MIVYLNGDFLPLTDAKISPLDRGFIFGDAIYEAMRVFVPEGASTPRIVGAVQHAERMNAGLRAIGLEFDAHTLLGPSLELVKRNAMPEALVYWQVSAGTPGAKDLPRSRVRAAGMKPTVFMYCSAQPPLASLKTVPTKKVVVLEDIRWTFGHVKSTSLLGNLLLAQEAAARGAEEAILARNETVTEGLATNVALVLGTGREAKVVTPSHASAPLLSGVTRNLLMEIEPSIESRRIDIRELSQASEVLMLGTTTYVTSCTHVDGRLVGDGAPGPVAKRLFEVLMAAIRAGRDLCDESTGSVRTPSSASRSS